MATLRPWKSCFEVAKDPSVLQKKQQDAVSTNQVGPGGQKHACLRSIEHVSVFLNRHLEIYFQKGTIGPSPCSLSIAADAQLPRQ